METVLTDIAELCFDETAAILYVKIKENVHIDTEKNIRHFKTVKELTKGKPYYALVDGSCLFTADEDALNYAALHNVSGERIGCAFYSLNLANRLTIHFFKVLHKPEYAITIFRTKGEALNCIHQAQRSSLVS
jgi:hypothetical protein